MEGDAGVFLVHRTRYVGLCCDSWYVRTSISAIKPIKMDWKPRIKNIKLTVNKGDIKTEIPNHKRRTMRNNKVARLDTMSVTPTPPKR